MCPCYLALEYFATQHKESSKHTLQRVNLRGFERTYSYLRCIAQQNYSLESQHMLTMFTLHFTGLNSSCYRSKLTAPHYTYSFATP